VEEQLEVDFLLLADRAEAVNGKLYMLGGAWERIGVADFAQPLTISIALGVLVPWSQTNMSHTVGLTLRDADGRWLDFRIEASFVTGRPPFLSGEVQRVLMAIPGQSVVLPGPGNYVLVASLDGAEAKSVRFSAVQAQPPAAGPPRPAR
jgi:hypothetical protein